MKKEVNEVDKMIKLYGKNCVSEAIKAKAPLKKVFLLRENAKKDGYLVSLLEKNHIPFEFKDKDFMQKTFGNHNQGYGAERSNYQEYDLDYLLTLAKTKKRVLVLDGVADPQNFGAIIRSADAFGFDAILLGRNRSVPITETVAHVSTGAIEYVPIIYVNSLSTAITKLKEADFWVIGTDATGDTLIKDIDKNRNLVVIIGSEGFGMSKTLVKASDYIVKIPMIGHVNSLNASVSAGILLANLMQGE